MNRHLQEAARRAGITLSGSLIAVARGERAHIGRRLVDADHWVHADVIDGSYRGQPGVGLDELRELTTAFGPRLDVHLMVDDLPGTIDALPAGIGRLTLQCRATDDIGALVRRGRERAASVWLAVDTTEEGAVAAAVAGPADGILIMLLPPGRPGHIADLARLDAARSHTTGHAPLGVDGGVTTALIPVLRNAGVRYAVAGRALLGRDPQTHPRAADLASERERT